MNRRNHSGGGESFIHGQRVEDVHGLVSFCWIKTIFPPFSHHSEIAESLSITCLHHSTISIPFLQRGEKEKKGRGRHIRVRGGGGKPNKMVEMAEPLSKPYSANQNGCKMVEEWFGEWS
jgi:hypothetical protein